MAETPAGGSGRIAPRAKSGKAERALFDRRNAWLGSS